MPWSYLQTFADVRGRGCVMCVRDTDARQPARVEAKLAFAVGLAQRGHTPWLLVHPPPCVVASHFHNATWRFLGGGPRRLAQ
jgi:hypothetical protein